METQLSISPEFSSRVSGYTLLALEADVTNGLAPAALANEIAAEILRLQSTLEVADINRIPAIAATRAAYKACGKDPNRYRPAQEQLHRRVVRGLGLYSVDTLVDLGNLLSLRCGCALGVFDRDKISGSHVELGVGHPGEPYTGIGRGPLNISGMPVLRDDIGPFASLTSDHLRTSIGPLTARTLITIHRFPGAPASEEILAEAYRLLRTYARASAITSATVAC